MAGFATADGAKDATTQVAHVLGSGHKKPTNLELWVRYALLNEPDWRGEAMVHALLRGLEAGEESARGAFLAWLLERGANVLDQVARRPEIDRSFQYTSAR